MSDPSIINPMGELCGDAINSVMKKIGPMLRAGRYEYGGGDVFGVFVNGIWILVWPDFPLEKSFSAQQFQRIGELLMGDPINFDIDKIHDDSERLYWSVAITDFETETEDRDPGRHKLEFFIYSDDDGHFQDKLKVVAGADH